MNALWRHTALLLGAILSSTALAQAPTPSAAKKELVAKVLQLQQPNIDGMARTVLEQPAMQVMQQVNFILAQRVPTDKRDALAREIEGDLRKYVEESLPMMRERASKLAPTTVGVVLEEKMSEEELKQVVAMLESPTVRKYQSLLGEMQRSFLEKLVAETRPTVQPRVQAMQQSVARRLAPYTGAASAPAGR
jgi:uncharacterized protein